MFIVIVNVYDLDVLPRNPTNDFKFKNSIFGATNVAENSDKENCTWAME